MDIDYVKKNIYIYIPILYTIFNLFLTLIRFVARNFDNKLVKTIFYEFTKRKPLQNILDMISFIIGIYAITGFFINV